MSVFTILLRTHISKTGYKELRWDSDFCFDFFYLYCMAHFGLSSIRANGMTGKTADGLFRILCRQLLCSHRHIRSWNRRWKPQPSLVGAIRLVLITIYLTFAKSAHTCLASAPWVPWRTRPCCECTAFKGITTIPVAVVASSCNSATGAGAWDAASVLTDFPSTIVDMIAHLITATTRLSV